MKILFDHRVPFALAHGGAQTQIEQTQASLRQIGVEAEPLRWWDDQQRGDLIHYFGPADQAYLQLAKAQKLPVLMTSLLTEACNRSDAQLARQGAQIRFILNLPFGEGIKRQLNWRAYNNCTHNVVGLQAESAVLQTVCRVPPDRISVVPLGLS